ncbi:protein of unknown function [Paenibacillus alvei]|uniref:Uncharacterized protein n=1 Tax=Paenibacillus alvei TaxID=44250 RepID=A0A383RME4_PAEAL|nr:protein of unknown function [Paenibacillus alvei]
MRKLEVASAWFSAYLTVKPLEETVEAFIKHRDFLHAMGSKVIVVSEQDTAYREKWILAFR